MTTALQKSRDLAPDDGTIQEAFVILDEKLTRWTAAMQEAQTALSRHASTAVLEEDEVEEPPYEEASIAVAVEEPPYEEASVAVAVEEEPVVDEPIGCDLNENLQSSPSLDASEQISDPVAKAGSAFGEKARASDDVKSVPVSNEDENLLASLDPETAKAIRVMRRLNPGKRSVKELLEEYEATKGASAAEPKKKSWWMRK